MIELDPTYPGERRETDMLLSLIKDAAEILYEPTVEYHEWLSHILYSYDKAMSYCDELEANGLKPNRLVVGLIILFHDAGISHNLLGIDTSDFDSKEAYSAHIAGEVLPTYGIDDDTIEQVQHGIMATKVGEPYYTLEAHVAWRADVANASEFHFFFTENSARFKREIEDECGHPIDDEVFVLEAERKLGALIGRDKVLGDWERDALYPKYSRFQVTCARNVQFLVNTVTGRPLLPIDEYIRIYWSAEAV